MDQMIFHPPFGIHAMRFLNSMLCYSILIPNLAAITTLLRAKREYQTCIGIRHRGV
ncbi:hypothetical protein ASPTUDRAFT_47483 [Aspergillus tubingensis CBS 134.48]|uniref:Uncharacterized protein n=1 Tax=Aspergillus tubingensis (strain CBS 134.48) TaxID=767770 RepID=A0A1L9MTL3_ASPTC|nr:hypothetical protein ASPTUDRAFT_47483 [Aspergillus tubingensis CBS 134.48]